jgi:hypothetical protein
MRLITLAVGVIFLSFNGLAFAGEFATSPAGAPHPTNGLMYTNPPPPHLHKSDERNLIFSFSLPVEEDDSSFKLIPKKQPKQPAHRASKLK